MDPQISKKVLTRVIVIAFLLPFLAMGMLGILTQSASAVNTFTDIKGVAKVVDIASFLGKPVRIPVTSENPDKIPGGDMDYLYVYPPQYYQNNKTKKLITIPIKSVYLASGKKISPTAVTNVKTNIENNINYSFQNQEQIFSDLKEVLKLSPAERQKSSSFQDLLRIFRVARADTTTDELNSLLNSLNSENSNDNSSVEGFSTEEIQALLESDDPEMKQLLMLLLLNLLMSQKLADASNVDKETCLDNGGEWINEECVTDETNDDSDQQATCEDSDGTWKSFSTSRALCLNRCGNEDADCKGSKLADFEESEGIFDSESEDIMGCKCGTGKCAGSDGECIDEDTTDEDDDEDDIPNGADKCADSSPDGSGTVNKVSSSPYYGCTCAQIQAMGGYQQQVTCPAGQCNGPYWTTYTAQQGSCNNGNVVQGQCVADNSGSSNQQMAQQCYQQDQQNKNNQAQQDQQKQQALQDLLKQLMGGGDKNKGGQQGGGKQGGGDQGGGGGGGCKDCQNGQQPGTNDKIDKIPQQNLQTAQGQVNKISEQMNEWSANNPNATPAERQEAMNKIVSDNAQSPTNPNGLTPEQRQELYRYNENSANTETAMNNYNQNNPNATPAERQEAMNKIVSDNAQSPTNPNGLTPQERQNYYANNETKANVENAWSNYDQNNPNATPAERQEAMNKIVSDNAQSPTNPNGLTPEQRIQSYQAIEAQTQAASNATPQVPTAESTPTNMVTNPDGTTTATFENGATGTYDSNGNLISETPAPTGSVANPDGTTTVNFDNGATGTYDANGNLVSQTPATDIGDFTTKPDAPVDFLGDQSSAAGALESDAAAIGDSQPVDILDQGGQGFWEGANSVSQDLAASSEGVTPGTDTLSSPPAQQDYPWGQQTPTTTPGADTSGLPSNPAESTGVGDLAPGTDTGGMFDVGSADSGGSSIFDSLGDYFKEMANPQADPEGATAEPQAEINATEGEAGTGESGSIGD